MFWVVVFTVTFALKAFGADPQVDINTNTVVEMTKSWSDVTGPSAFFGALKDSVEVHGVYSVTSNNDWQAGGGVAAQLVLAVVKLDACEFRVGPSYVIGSASDDIYQGVEAAVTTKFNGAKVQAWWAKVPMLGALPVSFDGATIYAGVGAAVAGPGTWQPTGFMMSVGVGGIKWGK
jgi:hypothetical protein